MSAANLFGGLLFGAVGFSAFIYGKKQSSAKPMLIGIALMAYPYFISNTLALYLVGAGLSASLFFFRD